MSHMAWHAYLPHTHTHTCLRASHTTFVAGRANLAGWNLFCVKGILLHAHHPHTHAHFPDTRALTLSFSLHFQWRRDDSPLAARIPPSHTRTPLSRPPPPHRTPPFQPVPSGAISRAVTWRRRSVWTPLPPGSSIWTSGSSASVGTGARSADASLRYACW